MIRFIKQAIKALLSMFGLVIFKRSTGIYIGEEETPALALRLCAVQNPLVIDGGAHKGSFVDAVRAVNAGARFLCFEPDPELASALREKFGADSNVTVIQSALGAVCGNTSFNINSSRANNSFASSGSGTTGKLGALMATQRQIQVEVVTLDEAMRRVDIPTCDIIKLDLQGHDLQALAGATSALASASVVIVEVWYAPVYTSVVTYSDIVDLLQKRGFALYSLVGLHYSTTDRLLWSDAVFLRSDSALLADPVTIS